MSVQWEEFGEGDQRMLRAAVNNRHAHVYPCKGASGSFLWFVDGGPLSQPMTLDQAKEEASAEICSVEACRIAPDGIAAVSARLGVPVPKPRFSDSDRRMIAPLSLLERTLSKLPPAAAVELQGRAERVKGYAEAVRDLVYEQDDPALLPPAAIATQQIREMLAEVGADAVALAEAGLELRRQHSRALALANARAEALAEELKVARAEAARQEKAIERIDARILRPCCEAAGKGDTSAVEALTGRVHLAWNPGRVEVDADAVDYLPPELLRVKPPEPDKAALKEALQSGAEFYGVRLVRERRVEVAG